MNGVMTTLAWPDRPTEASEPEPFFGAGLRTRLYVVEQTAEEAPPSSESEPEPLSPELCLVCPELRALALQQLPDRDPDSLPRRHRAPAPGVAQSAALPPQIETAEPREPPTGPPLVVSVLAYTVQQSLNMAAHGAVVIAAAAGIVALLAQLRG
jgi:hypothetical protein